MGEEATRSEVEAVPLAQEANAEIHAKTYMLVVAVNMIYVAQLFSVVGSGALSRNITAVTGGSEDIVWFTSIITICTTVLSPSVSQAADYWGRKWPLVFFTCLGFVGSMIVARAQNIATVLVGFTFSGLAFGAQALIPTISSEVIPRKLRSWAQGFVNIIGCLGGLVSLLFGGALVRNGHNEGFRVYFYICAATFALVAILCVFLYNPPPRDLQRDLKFSEKIRKLDWPAYFLLSSGVILFCIGLSWSQNPYPWTNARVLVPFTIGLVLLICLILYSWLIKKDGMIHHELFQHRNFPIALGCLFVEGLAFFSANNYIPFETSVLFTSDPLLIGAHLGISFVAGVIFAGLGGAWSYYTKTVRPPAIFAFAMFVIFYILSATINTSTPEANFWAYPIFVGGGVGLCITTLMTAAQFATPPELISITTGLVLAVRNLGGTVGLAIYNAVFNHCINANMAPKIADATVPLGLPENSLGAFISALTANNATALAGIPGVTETIIAAGGRAVEDTYVIAFRYVWVTAGAFSFCALIASCFIYDPKAEFNAHIDAPVEIDTIIPQTEKPSATA